MRAVNSGINCLDNRRENSLGTVDSLDIFRVGFGIDRSSRKFFGSCLGNIIGRAEKLGKSTGC